MRSNRCGSHCTATIAPCCRTGCSSRTTRSRGSAGATSTAAGWSPAPRWRSLAERDGRLVGYAFAHLVDGPDETFAVGRRYAELYSLSIAPGERGGGIGTQLLDELDRQLAAASIVDLAIAVMTDNEAARRFYERRGLRAVETVYWRIAPEAPDR